MSGASRRAPDDRFHRETDADVSLDGERDRQPHARVRPRVGQLMTDVRLVRHVDARRPCVSTHHALLAIYGHDQTAVERRTRDISSGE